MKGKERGKDEVRSGGGVRGEGEREGGLIN